MLYLDTEVEEINSIRTIALGIIQVSVVCKPVMHEIVRLMLCNQTVILNSFSLLRALRNPKYWIC